MTNILKATIRGHIRVVLGILGEFWLLCVLGNLKMQQSCYFLTRPRMCVCNANKMKYPF